MRGLGPRSGSIHCAAMAQTQALLLNAEIAAVLSSMRQNAKWALIPKQYSVRARQAPDCC